MLREAAHPQQELTPDLAISDPELFKQEAIASLATTEHGMELWNFAVDLGTLDPNNITLEPNTWVSGSQASTGLIKLGTAAMDAQQDKILYNPSGTPLPYGKEIQHRLLHEVSHQGFSAAYAGSTGRGRGEESPALKQVVYMTGNLRNQGSGSHGWTAIGSLGLYANSGTPGNRAESTIEDATELMTMYARDPEYLVQYMNFLTNTNPNAQRIKESVGLATVSQQDAATVFQALEHFFAQEMDEVRTRRGH